MLTLHELQNHFPRITTPAVNLLFDAFGRAGRLAGRLARLTKERPVDYVGGWAIKGREVDQPRQAMPESLRFHRRPHHARHVLAVKRERILALTQMVRSITVDKLGDLLE